MNKFLLSLILLPFSLMANQPSWFYNLMNKNNEIIGYGASSDLYEAKKYAIDEISKTISLNINSQFDVQKIYKKDFLTNKDISSKINIESNNNLSDINFIKAEIIDNIWYVAASYDNSTLIQKIDRHFTNHNLENESQNSYLSKSPLIKAINKELGFKLNYQLQRLNEVWYLSYKDKLWYLNQRDLAELLFFDYKGKLEINTNKITYDDNEQIEFNLYSKNPTFISILNIQYDGKVGLLVENKFIQEKSNIKEFKTINPQSEQILEQFIIIGSDDKLNLSSFTKIENELLNINDFNIKKLLELLDTYDFASKTIKINKGY